VLAEYLASFTETRIAFTGKCTKLRMKLVVKPRTIIGISLRTNQRVAGTGKLSGGGKGPAFLAWAVAGLRLTGRV